MGSIGNLTLNNNNASLNVYNGQGSSILNTKSTNTGNGTTNLVNDGTMLNSSFDTYGAHTNVMNNNFMNNFAAKDQNDDTKVVNNGFMNNASLVANGALGKIDFMNNNKVNNMSADANYGGQININNMF